jgi:hypothetical protein
MTNVNQVTPTTFELAISHIPAKDRDDIREVTLQLFGTVIPSIDIAGIDINFMGRRVNRDSSGALDFQDWNITYFINSNFSNWKILYDWITYIVDINALPSDHNTTAVLYIRNNFNQDVLKIYFYNVWIRNLGEVTLNTQSSEEFLQCTANLEYSRYKAYLPNEAIEG